MNLTFTKVGNSWEAVANVADDFNIHVECNEFANISVYQKTSGSKFGYVHDVNATVMDDDFDGVVYPKQIKVISSAEPAVGIITVIS